MDETRKKRQKKPTFAPDFGPFGLNVDHYFFFLKRILFRQSLDIKVSYHHVPYQKKTNDPINLEKTW